MVARVFDAFYACFNRLGLWLRRRKEQDDSLFELTWEEVKGESQTFILWQATVQAADVTIFLYVCNNSHDAFVPQNDIYEWIVYVPLAANARQTYPTFLSGSQGDVEEAKLVAEAVAFSLIKAA